MIQSERLSASDGRRTVFKFHVEVEERVRARLLPTDRSMSVQRAERMPCSCLPICCHVLKNDLKNPLKITEPSCILIYALLNFGTMHHASKRVSFSTMHHASKRVSFSTINIIELPMILGDNPSCGEGPPVQISWYESARYSFSINEFERIRKPSRRPSEDLYLSSMERSLLYVYSIDCNPI